MDNRQVRSGLRSMIVIGSLLGFFSSWILFAHSGKPVATPINNVPAVQQSAPFLGSQGSGNQDQQSFGLQPIVPFSPTGGFGVTRFRTSGS